MRTRWTAILGLVAACHVGGSGVTPEVSMPASFSSTGAATLPDRWWKAFGDPVLDGLIERGLARNPSILATWDRLAQASAGARGARSTLYPEIDGSADGSVGAHDDGTGVSSDHSVSLGLAASYEVDLWGRVGAARDAAAIDARASEQDVRAAAISLSAEIALTWYELVEQYGQDDLLQQQVETSQRTLDVIQARYDHGLVPHTDLLRQQLLLESLHGDVASSAAQTALLEHKLAVLVGEPPTAKVAERTTKLVALPPLPGTGVPSALMQRRPDVVRAYLQIQSADRRLAAAIADRFPRLGLSARASTSASSPQNLFTGWLVSLAASIAQPLFDGGERKAAVEQARAVVAEKVHDYSDVVLSALAEVEDALVQESSQAELVVSLDAQLDLSSRVLDGVRQAYTAGAIDYLHVLDAEETQQSLERRRLSAERQLVENRIALCRALAGGWVMTRPAG